MTLIEALVRPDAAEVDFDPPRVKDFYRSKTSARKSLASASA
jgi:hypothetical protein